MRAKPIPLVQRRLAFYAANPRHLQNLEQRFWLYVDKSGGHDACWPWTASTRDGYGRFKIESYVTAGSHRVAYLIGHGIDPAGLCVCHRCDNPPCCNPDHLFLGTRLDNTADMIAKGRKRCGDHKGESNANAILTAEQVSVIRRRILTGETNVAIAADYGVTHQLISRIRRGRSWGSEPMQPKYASLNWKAA